MSSEVRKAVAAALTDEWQTIAQIHARIDCWTNHSVSQQVKKMWQAGEVHGIRDEVHATKLRWRFKRRLCPNEKTGSAAHVDQNPA